MCITAMVKIIQLIRNNQWENPICPIQFEPILYYLLGRSWWRYIESYCLVVFLQDVLLKERSVGNFNETQSLRVVGRKPIYSNVINYQEIEKSGNKEKAGLKVRNAKTWSLVKNSRK